jgi:hypothetical protein
MQSGRRCPVARGPRYRAHSAARTHLCGPSWYARTLTESAIPRLRPELRGSNGVLGFAAWLLLVCCSRCARQSRRFAPRVRETAARPRTARERVSCRKKASVVAAHADSARQAARSAREPLEDGGRMHDVVAIARAQSSRPQRPVAQVSTLVWVCRFSVPPFFTVSIARSNRCPSAALQAPVASARHTVPGAGLCLGR